MKILFIADFFRDQLLGGGESNDNNLINFLIQKGCVVCKKNCNLVTTEDVQSYKNIIVGNFISLSEDIKNALIKRKNYIIYEHDHKYISTRDPSKFVNFDIPKRNIVNKQFYENAQRVVVLSEVCKKILTSCIPKAKVHNIGCSLWAPDTLNFIRRLQGVKKKEHYGILKSSNPTKNFLKTKQMCISKGVVPIELESSDYYEFLSLINSCSAFVFIPTVLETFSRVCAEAQMLNTEVRTVRSLIGFYSEDYCDLTGSALVDKISKKNDEAYKFFWSLII